jgi:hypothetical protein
MMNRIVTVDEHERLVHGERVEPGKDHWVPLRFGYFAHVQLVGVSSTMRIVESHDHILFVQVGIRVMSGT